MLERGKENAKGGKGEQGVEKGKEATGGKGEEGEKERRKWKDCNKRLILLLHGISIMVIKRKLNLNRRVREAL